MCTNENVFADVSSVVPPRGVGPLRAGGQGLTVRSLLAQLWPAAFALRQGKLLYRAHSRCPSYN
jgi:hypothetical protein